MKPVNLKKIALTAATLIVAAAVIVIIVLCSGQKLVLCDNETGKIFATFPVRGGDRFSVSFIHSVNKSPVVDIYEVRNGSDIYIVETHYFGFGAGVQTELNPGETLEYGDDGSMQIKNIDTPLPNLIYVVGTVSDHMLRIDGREISLRDLCGKSSKVRFYID